MTTRQPNTPSQFAQLLEFSTRLEQQEFRSQLFSFQPRRTGGLTVPGVITQSDTEYRRKLANVWRESFKTSFDLSNPGSKGYEFAQEAWGLYNLVQSGQVGEDEAFAHLQEKYPDAEFSAGKFQDLFRFQNSVRAIDLALGPTSSPTQAGEISRILQAQATGGVFNPLYSENNTNAIRIQHRVKRPRLTEEYSPENMSESLRRIADDTTQSLNTIANGGVSFAPGSLPGSVLRMGSIPVDRIDPVGLGFALRDMPGPDQAITLILAHDQEVDRWATYGGDTTQIPSVPAVASLRGPGRVWKVIGVDFPPGYTPAPGPIRYRLVTAGMRFGLFSIAHAATDYSPYTNDGLEALWMEYGIVIRGIPNLLNRTPQAILYTAALGLSSHSQLYNGVAQLLRTLPSSITYSRDDVFPFEDTSTTTGPIQTQFRMAAGIGGGAQNNRGIRYFNELEGYSPADAVQPDTNAGSAGTDLRGWRFNLLTGTTVKDVYAQLHSKFSPTNLTMLAGHEAGQTASYPNHLGHQFYKTNNDQLGVYVDSPVTPGLFVVTDSLSPSLNLEGRHLRVTSTSGGGGTNILEDDLWTEGCPFLFSDCQRLVADLDEFSVVVRPAFWHAKIGPGSVGPPRSSHQLSPAAWHLVGLETFENNDRIWGVDIVVV